MNKYERRETTAALNAIAKAITRLAIAVENRPAGWSGPGSNRGGGAAGFPYGGGSTGQGGGGGVQPT